MMVGTVFPAFAVQMLSASVSAGEVDRVAVGTRRRLERLDKPALGMSRENEPAKALVLGRVGAQPTVLNVAPQTRDILAEGQALAPSRVNTVGVVVNGRIADER